MLPPGDVSYEEHERLIGHSCGARPRIAISGGDDGVHCLHASSPDGLLMREHVAGVAEMT
jgi:hypothetical protein